VFSSNVTDLAMICLAMLSAAGFAWAFIAPRFTGELQAEERIDLLAQDKRPRRDARQAAEAGSGRRKQVEDSLKALEEREKAIKASPPLSVQLERSGLGWSKHKFFIVSLIMALVALALSFVVVDNLLAALAIAFAAGFGLPRWFVGFMINRRIKKFLNEFPNAVDVIVRGVKAGLPIADCFRIIAHEGEEPVRSEFRQILETQTVGMSLADAVGMLYEHIPVPEANFFGIVISVQQRSGGNLSEILGNLAKVLRDRKKMKAKVTAVSQEAKSSAAIIGALPILVMTIVYITTPDYIALLWTTETGKIMMLASGVWMSIGVLVMRKMINFDF
jgi:tight adherence protein B